MLTTKLLSRLRPVAIPALSVFLATSIPFTGVSAQELDRGVLDKPDVVMPTTGSGAVNQQVASAEVLVQDIEQLKKALKAEREELKKLSRQQLLELAEKGERAAQIVLAENYADEANHESITIISGNDAMSDAAYWYALAARRGYPGSPKIDGALPMFPLRTIRGPG